MKKFQYQIIRYIHDRMTAEFVNVGIVIYQAESRYLKCKVINKYSRLSNFFGEINGQYLLNVLRHFEGEVRRSQEQLHEIFNDARSIEAITSKILPPDDSALVCSEPFAGIDVELDAALSDLFDRLIVKYQAEPETDTKDDKYVWRKVYKDYFDKYGVTDKLTSHVVSTPGDDIEFEKAWKNGVWNCYPAVSFALKRADTVKNKVYKWSGIIQAMEKSNERIHLYFLTLAPRDAKLKSFVKETLVTKEGKSNIQVTVIDQSQAESFARKVKKELEEHLS